MPQQHTTNASPAAYVATQVVAALGDQLHDQAICLRTPVPSLVPLREVAPRPALEEFLTAYQPQVTASGLYVHQATIVAALKKRDIPNIVMTTATGSGKSLGFWAWAFEILVRDVKSTVIATFPTQALLWGQARRLANISCPESLVEFKGLDGACFAGTIKVANTTVPWSVWYGTAGCDYMKAHEKSDPFSRARLRICTLEKLHWSLMLPRHEYFLRRLSGVILDEAHSWYGLSGASVRAMIDRLRLSMDVLRSKEPVFFLASATLADAGAFAADLTGLPASSFLQINDKGASKASIVAAKDVPALLAQRAEPGLLRRYVLLVKPEPEPVAARAILGKSGCLGAEANALCFVQSMFVGHRLRQELHRDLPGKDVIAYDSALPPKDRRKIERDLFQNIGRAKVVVGTSALELGVDLPALDVVVMDELPPRRCDLLQRLGRVGRSWDRPGLAVLCLGFSPGDERLMDEPLAAVSFDDTKPIPLPLHLEVVRLKAMFAAFKEWEARLRERVASWVDFNAALERHFGSAPLYEELKNRCDKILGDVLDLDKGNWYYMGFRVSASQGKRELRLKGDRGEVVAVIEDIAIFRDAHPEGIYLGHRGASYRIRRYVGNWDLATWKSPAGVVLGKYMKGLEYIEVTEEKPTFATRGRWTDTFSLDELNDLENGHDGPAKGVLTFGTFLFLRKFNGYQEIDLRSWSPPKSVSLAEVAARFSAARQGGESFPFLHNFSYRTKGWKWQIALILDRESRETLGPIVGSLLHGFFCDAVECSMSDLHVMIDAQAGELRIVDGTPSGNGLSEALLTGGRVTAAWRTALKQIRAQGRKSQEAFHRYLAEECRIDTDIRAKEVVDAVERLADAWGK
jgi:hypothetical protein